MKSGKDVETLTINKHSEESEQLISMDTNAFEEPKNRGLNLRPLWRTVQRNILLITSIATVVSLGTFYSQSKSPRQYEGDFRLLVEPITTEAKFTDPSTISRDGGVATNNNGSTVDYPTLLQFLQSNSLLSGIIKQIQTKYPDVNYDSLTKDLVVERIGTNLSDSTRLIEVSYKGNDPKKVQFVLDEIAKGYLKYSLEDRTTRIGGGVKFIEDQLPRLQQQVDDLQGKVQGIQQRYNLSDPASDGAELSKQLRDIQAQRLNTQRELQEQKTLYVNLQKQLKLAPDEAITASTVSEDPNYQELLKQLKEVESQIAVESARFSEENPVIQGLREKQRNLSQLLNREARGIVGQSGSGSAGNPKVLAFQNSIRQGLIKQLVDTANQVQLLEVRSRTVAQAEASLNQQLKQFPAISRQYNDLQRRLDIATKTLNQLLVQRETLRVEAAQKEVPWEIVSAPKLPRDPAGNPVPVPGDSTKKLAMGIIAGLLLGLGIAILKERYRDVFFTSEDIEEGIELPLLGVTPFDRSMKLQSRGKAGRHHANGSAFLEAFNSLYTSIRFLAANPPISSLVVSSVAPGDGKSTVALHLAQAAAAMGQRVLLVDANLHQPELHVKLGLSNMQGLSDLLSQELNPDEFIQRSPKQDNLFVVTSGQLLPDSTKLLASTRMQNLIEQFQSSFDLVIYDTADLLEFADANFLAAYTDGILMVIGITKTKRSLVMQTINKLNAWHLPIIGTVANHTSKRVSKSLNYDRGDFEQKRLIDPTFENKPKVFKPDY